MTAQTHQPIRRSQRRDVTLEATIFLDDDKPILGHIQNFSTSGLLVKPKEDRIPKSDTPVLLGFHIPMGTGYQYHRLPVTVSRSAEGAVGLKFRDYDQTTVQALRSVALHAIKGSGQV